MSCTHPPSLPVNTKRRVCHGPSSSSRLPADVTTPVRCYEHLRGSPYEIAQSQRNSIPWLPPTLVTTPALRTAPRTRWRTRVTANAPCRNNFRAHATTSHTCRAARPPSPRTSTGCPRTPTCPGTAPALTLSQAECAELAPLLGDWFARGATEEGITHALTGGLPSPVHHPAALIRSRLLTKLPPEPAPEAPRTPRRLLECAECGVPGRPEALPGGVCGACRDTPSPPRPHAPLPAPSVHARAAAIRAKMPQRRQERTPA